jgi:ribosome-associated toxin RatA of RatAB toxin-antitoxin module
MPTVHRTTIVPYTSEQMFQLVNDIEHYPEFLPWCASTTVHFRRENEIQATLNISKGIVHRSFTTINHLTANKKVQMTLVDGPFKHLQGYWTFMPQEGGLTQIDFYIEFEFNNRLLDMGFAPVFAHITQTMVTAFTNRAKEVYAGK